MAEESELYTYTIKLKSLDFGSLTSIPEAVLVTFISASGNPFASKQYWPSLFMNNKVSFQNESFTHTDDSLESKLELFTSDSTDAPLKSVETMKINLAKCP